MNRQLVYDLPVRMMHWFFAGVFIVTFFIAKTVDDESVLFSYHMLLGIILSMITLLRLVWGFIGTKHARFSSFALHPKDLLIYFRGIVLGEKMKWSGHNPASSWAALIMFGLALGLGATGYFMSMGYAERLEDLHELLANAFAVVVILHISGIILHTIRHRDAIGLSMIDGRKEDVSISEQIKSSKPLIAVIFLTLIVTFCLQLFNGFDSSNKTIKLFGTTLQLGENETESESDEGDSEKAESEDTEKDDD